MSEQVCGHFILRSRQRKNHPNKLRFSRHGRVQESMGHARTHTHTNSLSPAETCNLALLRVAGAIVRKDKHIS